MTSVLIRLCEGVTCSRGEITHCVCVCALFIKSNTQEQKRYHHLKLHVDSENEAVLLLQFSTWHEVTLQISTEKHETVILMFS